MAAWRKSIVLSLLLAGLYGGMPMQVRAQGETKVEEASKLCRNLQPQFMLTGHLNPVTMMAVSADSKTLVSGDKNGVINIWSLETGKLLHVLEAHPGDLRNIMITPDGNSIVSVSSQNWSSEEKDEITTKHWNLRTGKLIESLTKRQGEIQSLNSLDPQTVIGIFSETSEASSDKIEVVFLDLRTKSLILSTSVTTSSISVTTNEEQLRENQFLSTQNKGQNITAKIDKNYGASLVKLQNSQSNPSSCIVPKLGRIQIAIFTPDARQLIVAGRRIEVMALDIIPTKLNYSGQQAKIKHLNELGFDKIKRKQYFSASRHFWQVFEINRQLGDESGQVDALYNIAEAGYSLCQVGRGSCRQDNYQEIYKLILGYFISKGDNFRSKVSRQRINSTEVGRSERKENLPDDLKRYRTSGNKKMEADTLVKMAVSLDYKYKTNLESSLNQALELYRTIGDERGEIEILHALGLRYNRMQQDKNYNPIGLNTSEATKYLNSAVELSRKIDDRFLESIILLDLGDSYRWARQYSNALSSYQLSLSIRNRLNDDTGKDILLHRIAQTFRSMGQYQLALENYHQSLSICILKEGNCLDIGREYSQTGLEIVREIGETYFTIKKYSKALHYFYQQKPSYLDWEGDKNIGIAYEKVGNLDLALRYFNRITHNRGPGCGDADTADATIVEAIRQDISSGNDGAECQGSRETWEPSLSIATYHSAEIYRRRGEYDKAIEVYTYIINRLRLNRRFQPPILNNLGTLYKAQGNYDQALKVYQEALWIRRSKEKDVYGEAVSLNNIGEVYRRQGQYSKSLDTYQQALGIFRNLIDASIATQSTLTPFQDIAVIRSGEASVLHNFGSVHHDLGQYEKAIDFYNQSLTISTTLNEKAAQGRSLNNLGLTYEAQKQYPKALETYRKALAARQEADDRPGIAGTLNNIGLLHIKLNQAEQGIEPLQQSLEIFKKLEDKASIANTLDSLGTHYTALNQSDKALIHYQQGLQVVQSLNLPPLEGVILSNMGNLLAKTNQPELAIVFYKQSVNIRESIKQNNRNLDRESQQSYAQSIAGTYRSLADLLINQGRLSEAQQVLELLKTQELRDFTRSNDNLTQQEIALLKLEKEILKKHGTMVQFGQKLLNCDPKDCQTLRDQLDQITIAFNNQSSQFQKELRQRLAQDPAFLTSDQLSGVASDIINAQPGSALIYPLILDNKIRLLLAVKAGPQGVVFRTVEVPNIGQKQLWEKVNQLRNQLQTPNSNLTELQANSAELYDWLIRPLEHELKTGKITSLVFSLDRATRYIPMGVLYDKTKKQYLAQQYPTSTILSAELTKMDGKLGTQNQVSILGLGLSNPVKGFSALNAVPAELSAIVRQPNQPQTKGIYNGLELLNEAFDLTSLRDNLKGQNILHIATHGSFEPGNPANSFILSGTGDRLTIDKLKTLSNYMRNIHLVVLSACQTAVGGPDESGIEVPGISFYFLQNKAKAVMASLWLVNDSSTALMMQQFYQHLSTGKTKAEALQIVQQDFISEKLKLKDAEAIDRAGGRRNIKGQLPADSFAHPYYWAPFILIGNSL